MQPVGAVQPVFEWFDVYGAMEPTTGDRCFLEWPLLNTEMLQLCVDAFAPAFPESVTLLLLDNSGAHTSQRLTLPENVQLIFLPPDGPELSPIERAWRNVKDELAWQQFTDLEAQQDRLSTLLRASEAHTLPSLTGYPDLVEAISALRI